MQQEVINLSRRIDALEHVIAMINVNLTTLEAAVDNAETELGISDKLFGMLNRLSFFVSCYYFFDIIINKINWILLFQKKTQEPIVSNRLPEYEPPTIYKTDDYFKNEWNDILFWNKIINSIILIIISNNEKKFLILKRYVLRSIKWIL